MQKMLLFLSMVLLLAFSAGCTITEEKEVMAGARSERYWEKVWEVSHRESHVEITPENAVFEASCRVKYRGGEPAEDVKIIIRSPLTYVFIEEHHFKEYGTVKPGEELQYHLYVECPSWRDKMPVGVFEEKLVDDFTLNSHVAISWKYGAEEFAAEFYDWESTGH